MQILNSETSSATISDADQVCSEFEASSQNMVSVSTSCRYWLQLKLLCLHRRVHVFLLLIGIIVLLVIRNLHLRKVTLFHDNSETDIPLLTLPESFSSARGAYCLDGSPPGYYYRSSPDPSVKSWIIYLPGGAWCTSEQNCYLRSLTALGSSRAAPSSMYYEGFLTNNCSKNPTFGSWNAVILLYCDGGSFLGNVSGVLNYKSNSLYLRGALIFDAVLEYLLSTTHLRDAKQIILSGSSAGGIGALVNADRLYSILPKSVEKLHVVVDGAMFVDVPSISGHNVTAETFHSVYQIHNLKSSVSIQKCIQKQHLGTEWRCLFPEVYHNYVSTPLFFINSVYDTWQRINFLKVPCFAAVCSNAQIQTVYKLRDAIQRLANQIVQSGKNGAYLTWCPFHTIITKPFFSDSDLGRQTLENSVILWLQHNVTEKRFDAEISVESALAQCHRMMTIY